MGFIPLLKLLLLAKGFPLVYLCVAGETQGGYPVVMGLQAHALTITLLV
jgi:hypothetical protein